MIDGRDLNDRGHDARNEFISQIIEAAGGAENDAAAELFDCSRELGFRFQKMGMPKGRAIRLRLPCLDVDKVVAAIVRGWEP